MAEADVGNNQSQFTIIPAPTESKTAGSTLTAANALCSVTPKFHVLESAANTDATSTAAAATITNGPGSDEPIPSTTATTADAATPTADADAAAAANVSKSTTAISKDDESCSAEIC